MRHSLYICMKYYGSNPHGDAKNIDTMTASPALIIFQTFN